MSNPKVSFWKPNNNGTGAVAHFDFKPFNPSKPNEESCFFVVMMPQNPVKDATPKFLKDKKLTVKLGLNDIGDMLAVIAGRKDGCGTMKDGGWSGLYHKNQQGNAIINFGNREGSYGISVSVKKGTGSAEKLSIGLTLGEIEILQAFFKSHMHNMFVEQYEPENSGE